MSDDEVSIQVIKDHMSGIKLFFSLFVSVQHSTLIVLVNLLMESVLVTCISFCCLD